jgi:exopolyphosphatase/guanosine-5'-triphosphate,3'-diphosphate pyrophosphatase
MKICCIDIGTNSVICLFAKIDSLKRLVPLKFSSVTTRLGKSLYTTGRLDALAQKKTLSVIQNFLMHAPADKYILAGTSALRIAKNSNIFTAAIFKKTGYKVKILSEKEEAQLAFYAVSHFLKPIPNKTIITDIGGGSTEFIFCNNNKILKKTSIPIGAVNITERFNNDTFNACDFIRKNIRNSLLPHKGYKLISIGGTVTTLGAILKKLKKYNPKKVHGITIDFTDVTTTLKKLNSLPLSARKKLLPFAPKRADIIVAGLCILKTIIEECEVKKLRICDKGLVYAIAHSTVKDEVPSAGK